MKTTINGQEYIFDPDDDTTAVEVLRQQRGLTGTKLVCGAGVCGACTVLVDGTPMTSCLLPAQHMADKQITTVEQFQGEQLHPVQRAFMAHDALQCGYCTPGFIVESIAFYERWRATHGSTAPSREAIAAALAGHLCRCGAYVGIYEAVQRACAGEYDDPTIPEPARVDALEKVTGTARYTADVQYPDQLVGRILRSPHAHATVLELDFAAARALEGVEAVISFIQVGEKLRFVGQEIAAVAAKDEHTAHQALAAIKVRFKQHPAVFEIDTAMDKLAPTVWEADQRKHAPNATEGPIIPGAWDNNVRKPYVNVGNIKAGKAQKALQAQTSAGARFEAQFVLAPQIHTAFEPHSCVAFWKGHDQLTVHLSTQAVHHMAQVIADYFDLNEDQVHVQSQYIGGAFGAKLGLTEETKAAVRLAREANKPVQVVFDRPEEMLVGGYRPGAQIDLSLVTDQQGILKGMRSVARTNSGIGINSMISLLMRMNYTEGKGPRELIDHDVTTHIAPGKPFRGPGGPTACWALEQSVDQIAANSGIDPIALRRQWDQNKIRAKVYDWIEAFPAWRERAERQQTQGRLRRGIGVAVGFWAHLYDPTTQVEVRTSPTGIQAITASQDMGNGSRTVVARAVAEVFGVAPSVIDVQFGSSQAVHGPRSGGSRTTSSLWQPAYDAAQKVRQQVIKALEDQGQAAVVPVAGGVQLVSGRLAWSEVLKQVPPQQAVALRGADAGLMDRLGQLAARYTGIDNSFGQGSTGGAYVTEVEVDTLLGKVRVCNVWGVMAAGKIHVPALARSQVYGGVIQGIGYALYEEKVLDPRTGRGLSMGLEDYRIAGIADIPPIEVTFIEEGFEHVKGGGVGLAEIATVPMAASIANAVYHATGWRPLQAPIRPDRVLKGVQA